MLKIYRHQFLFCHCLIYLTFKKVVSTTDLQSSPAKRFGIGNIYYDVFMKKKTYSLILGCFQKQITADFYEDQNSAWFISILILRLYLKIS